MSSSYMRPQQQQQTANAVSVQQQQASAEQMHHNFLKDKQAWEHAIAMYQGPDPLDHWYNYLTWYENHVDPENKFRETLERCLTQYEHSDYYKQDIRMVRLWLKYIDMQANPLHFYQVLHKRGVGRQIACFYISWAAFYESENAFKEAESVFNLAFQQKAQPLQELQHAHGKLMYTRAQQQQQMKLATQPNAHSAQTAQPQQQQQQHHAYANIHSQQPQHVQQQAHVPHNQSQVHANYRPPEQHQGQQIVYHQQQQHHQQQQVPNQQHPSQQQIQYQQQHANYSQHSVQTHQHVAHMPQQHVVQQVSIFSLIFHLIRCNMTYLSISIFSALQFIATTSELCSACSGRIRNCAH